MRMALLLNALFVPICGCTPTPEQEQWNHEHHFWDISCSDASVNTDLAADAQAALGSGGAMGGGDASSMYGGLLYGNPTHGDTVSSTPTHAGETTCIVVPIRHTGSIASVQIQKRAIGTGQAASSSTGEYSQGNGGTNYLRIQSVGSDGRPTDNVLGTSAVNFGYGQLTSNGAQIGKWDQSASVPMMSPVSVVAGQKVALCLHNAGSGSNWISTNFMEAYEEIPRSTGLQSGPYWGNTTHVWRNRGAGFTDDRRAGNGYWEIRYTDSFADGNPYDYGSGTMNKSIGGNDMVREKFTVAGGSRTVIGIWFRAYYKSGAPSPLVMTLQDAKFSTIAQVDVDRSKISCAKNFFRNSISPPDFAGWTYVALPRSYTLANGNTYYLQMSASTGTYNVQPVEKASYGGGAGEFIVCKLLAGRIRTIHERRVVRLD